MEELSGGVVAEAGRCWKCGGGVGGSMKSRASDSGLDVREVREVREWPLKAWVEE